MPNHRTDRYKIDGAGDMAVGTLPPVDRHPGQFLKEVILPEYGVTNVADLARRLDVQRVGLVKILSGKTAISRPMAYRFGALLNDHVADLLIAYQHAWDLREEQGLREAIRQTIERLPEPAAA
ncbi:MAG TPA: hypothetical protein PKD99_02175 [Sphingopyxis sp.]|nr:hypothetical protein [Sphingopyxis sp.]HMP43883.1 hypothetical protein [Sphingopyxis sp.]HMQ18516.1 hypothetical protein [Sphingopyxis sp.]